MITRKDETVEESGGNGIEKVEEMDKNRIGKIRIQIHHPEESEDGEKEKDGEHE